MMSTGLESMAGKHLKSILSRFTQNPLIGILTGTIITAVIQSSSAVTVMAVGFVNVGVMTLEQAVWIVMGANIGTTITGQMIAFQMDIVAYFLAGIGVILLILVKDKTANRIGQIMAGIGILFIGMEFMGNSMQPLKENTKFLNFMVQFQNPIWGIIAGTIFTAVIQSSSASLGILQALSKSGAIGLETCTYIIFGQNIGTCITSLLASIGTCSNAKRVAIVHVAINVIGTVFFTIICMCCPAIEWVRSLTPDNPMMQIANMHTIFNIASAVILLPFGKGLRKLAVLLLPDKVRKEEKEYWIQMVCK